MGDLLNPFSEKPIKTLQIPHLFFHHLSIILSEYPQLFRLRRSQFIEGLSIGFGDVHIEIVIGDDGNAVTGNVGGP